jgi:hypothetical protein
LWFRAALKLHGIAADHEEPRRLYAAIEVGGMLVTDDDGQHWTAAIDGLANPDGTKFFQA